jgi:membrane protein implicated in regulation of membrane protease activity
MCHSILFLPLLGLPIFWLMPLSFALPSYSVIVLISVFLYWFIAKSMKQPLQDGFQSLIGTEAEVVSEMGSNYSTKYLVRSQGELWRAYASERLQPGDQVSIVAVKGIGLVVQPAENKSHSPTK